MAVSVTEFQNALKTLSQALKFADQESDVDRYNLARDASIQRFEFCVELAWKVSAKKMGSSSITSKPVLREMAAQGLISNIDLWFDFIEARNKSSHTYKEEIAAEVFAAARKFVPEGEALCQKLLTV